MRNGTAPSSYNRGRDIQGLSGMMQTAITPQDFAGLQARRQALDAYWQQDISGYVLLHKHSDFIDHHLAERFEECVQAGGGFALVAVGGYAIIT